MRIQKDCRRWGRGTDSRPRLRGRRIIKIGWKGKSRDGKEIPVKLAGFLICFDSVDAKTGRLKIDYEAMRLLGYGPEQIQIGLEKHFNAPDGCLPDTLHFAYWNDAVKGRDGKWTYPKNLIESYQLWGKDGLKCHGDGCTAWRKQPDGTEKEIACVPHGKMGADPSTFCEFSGPGAPKNEVCKDRPAFAACLIYFDENRRPRPLFPDLGMNGTAVLHTTSEHFGVDSFTEMDEAADRLNGNLCGINGTMTLIRKERRAADGKKIVGHVSLSLDQRTIIERERQMFGSKLLGRSEALSIGSGHPVPTIELKQPQDNGAIYPEPEYAEFEDAEETGAAVEQSRTAVQGDKLWEEADGALADGEEAAPAQNDPEKAEAVEQLLKMSEALDIGLGPYLKMCKVERIQDLKPGQIEYGKAWLNNQQDKRLAGVAK